MLWRIAYTMSLLCLAACLVGCAGRSTLKEDERPTSRPVASLGVGFFEERVEAFVIPPTGWTMDPPKVSDERTHLTWLSPSRDTAYGVVYFSVPTIATLLPEGRWLHEQAVGKYVEGFQEEEPDAELVDNEWDDRLNAMRVEVEGGPYHVRSILALRGGSGWNVYAGSTRGEPIVEEEYDLAVQAREATRFGLDAAGGRDAAVEAMQASEAVPDSGE
jgi:hypothetical protein